VNYQSRRKDNLSTGANRGEKEKKRKERDTDISLDKTDANGSPAERAAPSVARLAIFPRRDRLESDNPGRKSRSDSARCDLSRDVTGNRTDRASEEFPRGS